ncbi:MAG: YhjD/YihY/BrkB family envelope integrity protein [Myxococcota bacterium]
MKWLDWPARIRDFLSHKLWEIEPEERSRLSALRFLQFSIMLGEGFVRDQLLLRASALTYFTVLSVVPLLAVAVAIASAVGVGSGTFVDWVVGTLAAGAPGAAAQIRGVIEGVDFASIGTLGAGVLFLTTVLAISSIESTLNDIWGVAAGRSWLRRFSDYLAVLIVAPVLTGVALSLATTLRTRWASTWLFEVPALRWLDDLGGALVPVFLLSITFTFLYWFLPNTRVNQVSAAIGGVVAGIAVTIVQAIYIEFSVGLARAEMFFGGFALIPLLFAWMYVFWAVVLFGAQIAFAHQNFELYRKEVRGDPAGPAEREAIALRIALEVARCFRSRDEPPTAEALAEELRVPVRTVRAVTTTLIESGILSTRSDGERDDALQLGRPGDTIAVTDVLNALRGRREAPRGERAGAELVQGLLGELESAAFKAAGDRSLADLLVELRQRSGDVDQSEAPG